MLTAVSGMRCRCLVHARKCLVPDGHACCLLACLPCRLLPLLSDRSCQQVDVPTPLPAAALFFLFVLPGSFAFLLAVAGGRLRCARVFECLLRAFQAVSQRVLPARQVFKCGLRAERTQGCTPAGWCIV